MEPVNKMRPVTESLEGLHCPKCGYPQYCGCPVCKPKIPARFKPYHWKHGELIVCGNCGFTQHCDWWLTLEGDVFLKDSSTTKAGEKG